MVNVRASRGSLPEFRYMGRLRIEVFSATNTRLRHDVSVGFDLNGPKSRSLLER